MTGGQAAIRGFLLQTVLTVFRALNGEATWAFVQIEPDVLSEKVDILWYYLNGTSKAVQVKSSENTISVPIATKWANTLYNSLQADQYELVLIGPRSERMTNLGKIGEVNISPPLNIDLDGWISQTAHELDIYLFTHGLGSLLPNLREILVGSLVTQFEIYSTKGNKVSISDFDNLLVKWIISMRDAVTNRGASSAYERIKRAAINIVEKWKRDYRLAAEGFIELSLREDDESQRQPKISDIKRIVDLVGSGKQVVLKGCRGQGRLLLFCRWQIFL